LIVQTNRVVCRRSIHAFAFQHEQGFQDRRIDRFDEHQVDACLVELPAAGLVSAARDRDDEALFTRRDTPNLSGDLAPVHERHFNVQQHDIGVLVRTTGALPS
jgi:hypothetical protein